MTASKKYKEEYLPLSAILITNQSGSYLCAFVLLLRTFLLVSKSHQRKGKKFLVSFSLKA